MVDKSTNDATIVLSGFNQLDCGKTCNEELAFKSGGITYGGQAVAMKLPESAFLSKTAPTLAEVKQLLSQKKGWSIQVPNYSTVRSARSSPSQGDGDAPIALLLRNPDQETSALQKVKGIDGSIIWHTGALNASMGQGTAIAIGDDGNIAMTGLSQSKGRYPKSMDTVGRLSLFDGQRGDMIWTRSYTVGGVPELIRHECWGVVAIDDEGYAIICGTGIEPEQCNSGLPPAVRKNCTKGIGDNRPGAVPRAPDIWQSFVVMSDQQGKTLWERVDSYRPPHSHAPLGASGGSAAEWGVLTKEGGVLVCMDDPAAGSLGLMELRP
jgi:hypothetical protein